MTTYLSNDFQSCSTLPLPIPHSHRHVNTVVTTTGVSRHHIRENSVFLSQRPLPRLPAAPPFPLHPCPYEQTDEQTDNDDESSDGDWTEEMYKEMSESI